ncbi:MAG: DUF512 domain-containing protein, partial [Firmicutes bacterium]|nr:DUF512 domain-containing protein [Bacillota bacterium]
RIAAVRAGSPAAEAGIREGDLLRGINGEPVGDVVDYRFAVADESLRLSIEREGKQFEVRLEKGIDEELGLAFEHPALSRMKSCRNRCVFCFIDQLPRGLRRTLYVKDDDYRLSPMHGTFVTLTNLDPDEWRRLLRLRLSPLYVSVHALDPEIRSRLLGTPRAAAIREQLEQLAQADIEVHTQIVLCPGLNDGAVLEETVGGLASYWPSVQSVGIVPVGLSSHRGNLPDLASLTEEGAGELAEWAGKRQLESLKHLGSRFVFLADEIYLLAGLPFPPRREYGDFPQLENGIGIARRFLDEWMVVKRGLGRNESQSERADGPGRPSKPGRSDRLGKPSRIILATGLLAAPILERVTRELGARMGAEITVEAVPNTFFGDRITVAGLLTGKDLAAALGTRRADLVLLPEVMIRESLELGEEVNAGAGSGTFLDGWTVKRLAEALGTPVRVIPASARTLIESVTAFLAGNGM